MADIQLSPQLFQDVQEAISRHHADADIGITLQYLSAVSGYLLGSERGMSQQDKDAYLQELQAFMGHVYQDISSRQQQQQAAPPVGNAFGIWEPPKK